MIGLTGDRTIDVAVLVVGAESSIRSVEGVVTSTLAANAFGITSSDQALNVILTDDSRLLNSDGRELTQDFVVGDEVEAWGQSIVIDAAAEADFPAFLALFSSQDDADGEDTVRGSLIAIDGDRLTIRADDVDQCVLNVGETDIQQISDDSDGAESSLITLVQLTELLSSQPQIDAFGTLDDDCLVADVIVVESSD